MNIFIFEVKRLFKSCLIWSLICGASIVLFMLLFPSMQNSGIQELIGTKLDAFPQGFLEAFGLDTMVDFTDIMQYQAYSIQYIGMAAAIFGSILGIDSLLQEEVEGTIEFLYAQPVSRSEVVTYKILSRFMIFFIFMAIFSVFTMGISIIVKPKGIGIYNIIMDIKMVLIGIFFIGIIFFSIGLFLSASLKPSYNSTAISIGVFFITYILGIISNMKDNMKFLRYFSPFDYALPMDIVREGWNIRYIILGLFIILVCIVSTYVIYKKRDFRI